MVGKLLSSPTASFVYPGREAGAVGEVWPFCGFTAVGPSEGCVGGDHQGSVQVL